MNTDMPSLSAEEGAVSAPFEKLPKLNLPPKPVLATATVSAPPLAPVNKPAAGAPSMVTAEEKAAPPALTQVVAPTKKPEVIETATAKKKTSILNLPLAMLAFVAALLGLVVQVLTFLHLF